MSKKTMQEVGALLVRVILGLVFINHGLDKFQALEGTAGFFTGNELHIALLTMSLYLVLAGSPLLAVDKLLPFGQKRLEEAK